MSVLLIQDAVLGNPTMPVPVYVNSQDLQARGVARPYVGTETPTLGPQQLESEDLALPGRAHLIDYDQICQMIIDHDRTVVW